MFLRSVNLLEVWKGCHIKMMTMTEQNLVILSRHLFVLKRTVFFFSVVAEMRLYHVLSRHFSLSLRRRMIAAAAFPFISNSYVQGTSRPPRVHIIKRALSSRKAASWGERGRGYPPPTGGGYGGSPPRKCLTIAFSCYFWQFLNAEKRVIWKAIKCWWGSIVAEVYLLFV